MATTPQQMGEIKMINSIDTVKTLIERATVKNGGHEDIAFLDQAEHACNPNHPHMWQCDAVQLQGDKLYIGKAYWDFTEYNEENGEPDDLGVYEWDDCCGMWAQHSCDIFNLNDDDELAEAIEELQKWI